MSTTQKTNIIPDPKAPWISFISGGLAGVTAKSAMAPLERVKILYQIKSELYSINSFFGSVVKIIENEGLKGLWRGNSATILRVFPYASVQFLSYETINKHFVTDKSSSFQNFLAGSAAGSISVIVTYPLDLTRARLAIDVDKKKYTKPTELISKTFKADGIRGIYRGIQPTLVGILPYGGFSFSTYEYFKKNVPPTYINEDGKVNKFYTLVTGGISGGVAQLVSYPFDTVRRRMQTHGFGDAKAEINLSHGTLRSIYSIWRKEGLFSLYKGLSINFIKVIPTTAIAFCSYEFFSSFFAKARLNF